MKIAKSIFSILILSFLAACSPTERELSMLGPRKDMPVREAFQVNFIFSEIAVIKATLKAPHAVEKKEGEESVQVFDQGLVMTFFDEKGVQSSELIADHGIFRGKFEKAEFKGNVHMINATGENMLTDVLFWDKTAEILWAPYMIKKPRPVFHARKEMLDSGKLPDAIGKSLDLKFADQPDSVLAQTIRSDIDSLVLIKEKTDGDKVLHNFLLQSLDTTWTQAVYNQVEITTETELIYGDSLQAKTDFSEYKVFHPRGAIEMKEGL